MNFHLGRLIVTAAATTTLCLGAASAARAGWQSGLGRPEFQAPVAQVSDDWMRAYALGATINEIARQQRVQQYYQRHCRSLEEPITDDWGNVVDVQQTHICDD